MNMICIAHRSILYCSRTLNCSSLSGIIYIWEHYKMESIKLVSWKLINFTCSIQPPHHKRSFIQLVFDSQWTKASSQIALSAHQSNVNLPLPLLHPSSFGLQGFPCPSNSTTSVGFPGWGWFLYSCGSLQVELYVFYNFIPGYVTVRTNFQLNALFMLHMQMLKMSSQIGDQNKALLSKKI